MMPNLLWLWSKQNIIHMINLHLLIFSEKPFMDRSVQLLPQVILDVLMMPLSMIFQLIERRPTLTPKRCLLWVVGEDLTFKNNIIWTKINDVIFTYGWVLFNLYEYTCHFNRCHSLMIPVVVEVRFCCMHCFKTLKQSCHFYEVRNKCFTKIIYSFCAVLHLFYCIHYLFIDWSHSFTCWTW